MVSQIFIIYLYYFYIDNLSHISINLDGTVTNADGSGTGISYGGGGTGPGRVKDRGVYGDWSADSEPDDYVADNEEEFIEE